MIFSYFPFISYFPLSVSLSCVNTVYIRFLFLCLLTIQMLDQCITYFGMCIVKYGPSINNVWSIRLGGSHRNHYVEVMFAIFHFSLTLCALLTM